MHAEVPGNLEHIVISTVEELRQPVDSVTIARDHYIMRDLGLMSLDTFDLFALIDARLGRRLPFEALIVAGDQVKQDLTIGEIVDFIRAHWHGRDLEPQPR